MTDFRGEDEEPPFEYVTIRMTVPASIGASHVRAEFSNCFGDEPVLIRRGAITTGDRFVDLTFGGKHSIQIPVGGSQWIDPIALTVHHSLGVCFELYLPDPTPYARRLA